jgi:hypothetical protein
MPTPPPHVYWQVAQQQLPIHGHNLGLRLKHPVGVGGGDATPFNNENPFSTHTSTFRVRNVAGPEVRTPADPNAGAHSVSVKVFIAPVSQEK